MTRFLRPWRLVLYILCIAFTISWFSTPSFTLPSEVVVQQGDTYQVFLEELWRFDRMRTRRALWWNEELQPLQVWAYQFSWTYTPQLLIDEINEGPSYEYVTVTLLEWRSSYDMDRYLVNQWLIQPWEYIAFVTDREVIERNAQVYPFLAQALRDRADMNSLEWYLYPETYRLDTAKPIISQLVRTQLQTFESRVWQPYGKQLVWYSTTLANQWRQFSLSSYGAVILASIILKEEQRASNMPAVSGVFMNRLDEWMRLGADITLCYGLATWYETCTPEQIVEHLYDRSNLYNTRELAWLTPTPIANVTNDSMSAVLSPQNHDNLFYLHDPSWWLHMARTNAEHNSNKSKYLR
jgi:uncharacterized YceG family protein